MLLRFEVHRKCTCNPLKLTSFSQENQLRSLLNYFIVADMFLRYCRSHVIGLSQIFSFSSQHNVLLCKFCDV